MAISLYNPRTIGLGPVAVPVPPMKLMFLMLGLLPLSVFLTPPMKLVLLGMILSKLETCLSNSALVACPAAVANS